MSTEADTTHENGEVTASRDEEVPDTEALTRTTTLAIGQCDSQQHVVLESTDRSLPMPPRPLPHIPMNEEEKHHVEEVHGSHSWEAKVLHVLHSKYVQYTLMGLLLLDVVILFIELFLGAQYPSCTFIIRDAISCCPGPVADDDHRFLAGNGDAATCEASVDDENVHMRRYLEAASKEEHADDGGHHAVCEAGVDTPQCAAGCDEHKYDTVHKVHKALFFCTITILSLFMVELLLLIICLKPRVFFRKAFYVLDLVVVSTSLALESFFYAANDETLQSLVGLIVLARLWRFVRIGHGLVEVTHEYASRKHDKLVSYNNELEKLLIQNDIDLPSRKKKMRKLKRMDSPESSDSSSGVD